MKKLLLPLILIYSMTSFAKVESSTVNVSFDSLCKDLDKIDSSIGTVRLMKKSKEALNNNHTLKLREGLTSLYMRFLIRNKTDQLSEFDDDIKDCGNIDTVIREINFAAVNSLKITQKQKNQILKKLADGKVDNDNIIHNVAFSVSSIGAFSLLIVSTGAGDLVILPAVGVVALLGGSTGVVGNYLIKNAPADYKATMLEYFDKQEYNRLKEISEEMAIVRAESLMKK